MQRFEYRTTYAPVPDDFPNHEAISDALNKLTPKPPKGEEWRLATSATVVTQKGAFIIFSWERPLEAA